MGVLNRKERFATEGIRFQRHNGDGTIPTPQRFLGFANTVDLTKVLDNQGKAPLTIKIDYAEAQTKLVDFSGVVNPSKVTTTEAATFINAVGFPAITFSVDAKTTRLCGGYASGTPAQVTVELENSTGADEIIPAATYGLFFDGKSFTASVQAPIMIADGSTAAVVFTAVVSGVQPHLPSVGDPVDVSVITPALPSGLTGEYTGVVNGTVSGAAGKIIQVTGPLAAALDFGNCLKHGGNGLEVISFFDDETISIGLPKDIKDKEEIDIEGAKGTITRMVIGAMLQGLSPVVTLKQKDYILLELIQGGRLDREAGTYDPPLSMESDHPSFWAEIFSAVYSPGSNKVSDVAGYERLLLRSMIGMEGDVPIDAKSWAQYAFNLTATEYTDENDVSYPAWQEQSLTLEQFDALKVKQVKIS